MNIPEKKNENLNVFVEKIYDYFGLRIPANARVPTKVENLSKNIVVKFSSKLHRYGFLSAASARRTEPGSRVFINEHLTIRNKILFRSAHILAKEKILYSSGSRMAMFNAQKRDG